MIYEFEFLITPCSKERPRFSNRGGVMRTYTAPKTRKFENEIAILAKKSLRGGEPMRGPIVMDVTFEFKQPKKTILDVPKQDLDNCVKSLWDGLNGIAFYDDKQIFGLMAKKLWSDRGCITVWLSNELEGNQ